VTSSPSNAWPTSKRWALIVSDTVHAIATGLWLGGFVALGAIAAPLVVMASKTAPELSKIPVAVLLGPIVGGSFRVFNYVCMACGGLMFASDLVSLRLGCSKWFRDLTTVRTYVTLFLIAHTLILSQKIFPLMDRAKAAGNMTLFDSLHHFYEHMSYFALLMLVVIIVLTAMRNSRHYDE